MLWILFFEFLLIFLFGKSTGKWKNQQLFSPQLLSELTTVTSIEGPNNCTMTRHNILFKSWSINFASFIFWYIKWFSISSLFYWICNPFLNEILIYGDSSMKISLLRLWVVSWKPQTSFTVSDSSYESFIKKWVILSRCKTLQNYSTARNNCSIKMQAFSVQ